MMPCILGIDPGVTGAVAYYFPEHPSLPAVEDLPIAGAELDLTTFADRVQQMRPTMAVVEQVHSMPKQGVSSTFKFGMAYGGIRGVLCALDVPTHLVTPQRWKRHHNLIGTEKDAARALALRLFPDSAAYFSRKRDQGRADASLIARYGAEILLMEVRR